MGNDREDLKKKVTAIDKLKKRINDLQDRMNKMEFVNEVEHEGITELACSVYYVSVAERINEEISRAIDAIGEDPAIRIAVANEILTEMGLKPIRGDDATTCGQVFDEYLSRF